MAAFAAAAVAVTPSCTKTVQPDSFNQEVTLQENAALEEFAAVLSKVVTGSEEVRAFFKDEALKQFDRDFDVFYPYVKDHKFSSGETLREMLIANETYEGQIETIERAVPKLTVLIPDFSWLDADFFSVKNWDTTIDRLCVGFDDDATAHRLYFNGEYLGALPASNMPAFPVMIVKSNERMSVSASTKGGANVYYFADPAFDGSKATKGLFTGGDKNPVTNPNPDKDSYSATGNFISATELYNISPSAIQAYDEFGTGSTNGVQRDYIYYGMTKKKAKNGMLNPFMRDMLYRIRLTPAAVYRITDDPLDPKLDETLWTYTNDRPGFEDALPRLAKVWGNGNYEFRIQFFQGFNSGSASSVGSWTLSVAPLEIMAVKKLTHTFNWDWFSDWSTYKITQADIESKWYYPGDTGNDLPMISTNWNLASVSDNMWVRIVEYDPDRVVVEKKSHGVKKSRSVTAELTGQGEIKNIVKIGLGVSGSFGSEDVDETEYTMTTTLTSDDLGEAELNYVDNYIIARASRGGKSGYELKSWGNGYYSFTLLPINTSNEYQIKEFLKERKNRN